MTDHIEVRIRNFAATQIAATGVRAATNSGCLWAWSAYARSSALARVGCCLRVPVSFWAEKLVARFDPVLVYPT